MLVVVGICRLAFPQYDMPVEIIKKELRPIITRLVAWCSLL